MRDHQGRAPRHQLLERRLDLPLGLGIERRQGVAEPEDHIAALCEVMAMIISSHGLQLDQSAFFESYVASWAGRFFEDLGKAGAADFYRAVSQLGQAFLEVEQRYFSLPG